MKAEDPNVQRVEAVASALGDLRDELVLVGGCAASLLIDAPAAPSARVTYDVDLVAVVAALRDYHALERQFAAHGFTRDVSPDAPICRWSLRDVQVDLMPTDEKILGFSNRWYAHAAATANRIALPSGALINLISGPSFLATKFEAFISRGRSDIALSHDFEDIVNVVEGRPALVDEVAASAEMLREYLASSFAAVLTMEDFENVLPGLVAADEMHERRIAAVRNRIKTIASPPPP